MRGFRQLAASVIAAMLLAPGAVRAADNNYEFSGKTIEILVGQSAGGGHDTTARVYARHLGKHLPGEPNVIVRNMPGADDRVMMNYLYNDAEPDGLTLATMNFSIPGYQLRGEGPEEGVRFDVNELSYIGSPTVVTYVMVVHKRTGITAANLRESMQGKSLRFGDENPGSGPHTAQVALALGMGWDLESVFGYEGDNRTLALERGEVDAAITTWESLEEREAAGLASGDLIPVVTIGVDGPALDDPLLQGVPTADELFADASEEAKASLAFVQGKFGFARSLIGPPDMEPELLELFRTAFDEMNADPEYVADAEKFFSVVPTPGSEVERRVAAYMALPPEAVEALSEAIKAATP